MNTTPDTADIMVFSPTGGTKKISGTVALGMEIPLGYILNLADLPLPEKWWTRLQGNYLIIGTPVYAEHSPTLLRQYLSEILFHHYFPPRNIVVVSVCGKITHGTAAEEIASLFVHHGHTILGLGKFVAEHSFSSPSLPIAAGRPDRSDILKAKAFGNLLMTRHYHLTGNQSNVSLLNLRENNGENGGEQRISKKSAENFSSQSTPEMRGRAVSSIPFIDPEKCNRCKMCYAQCPGQAIDILIYSESGEKTVFLAEEEKCIRCFRCVRVCPHNALTFTLKFPEDLWKWFRLKIDAPLGIETILF